MIGHGDRELLEALIAAAKRGNLQGTKAGGRTLGSARNIVLKSAAVSGSWSTL